MTQDCISGTAQNEHFPHHLGPAKYAKIAEALENNTHYRRIMDDLGVSEPAIKFVAKRIQARIPGKTGPQRGPSAKQIETFHNDLKARPELAIVAANNNMPLKIAETLAEGWDDVDVVLPPKGHGRRSASYAKRFEAKPQVEEALREASPEITPIKPCRVDELPSWAREAQPAILKVICDKGVKGLDRLIRSVQETPCMAKAARQCNVPEFVARFVAAHVRHERETRIRRSAADKRNVLGPTKPVPPAKPDGVHAPRL